MSDPTTGEVDEQCDASLNPKTSEENIMLGNTVTTFGEAVAKYTREKTAELAKVCYHETRVCPVTI